MRLRPPTGNERLKPAIRLDSSHPGPDVLQPQRDQPGVIRPGVILHVGEFQIPGVPEPGSQAKAGCGSERNQDQHGDEESASTHNMEVGPTLSRRIRGVNPAKTG